jgi:hypothetical protein
MDMLAAIKNNLINIPGWSTSKKIIVIESDDWGMIRMASKEAYQRLLRKGYPVDSCVYNRNDSLETGEDLEQLLSVLDSVKDRNGHGCVFTINNIVANPDFEKIKASDYRIYSLEPFTETLKRFENRANVMGLYQEGISAKLLKPEFHGREHFNLNRWMEALQNGSKPLLDAFGEGMFTVAQKIGSGGRRDYLDAFGEAYTKEIEHPGHIIRTGIRLFREIWGEIPKSFIAPCYVWPPYIEKPLSQEGVKYIQGTHVQRIPVRGPELAIHKKYHYQGQKNQYGQRYLIRNVFFEPVENPTSDWVGKALKEIRRAFRYGKPAIISSHRVNYMGSLNPKNRQENLYKLNELLRKVISIFPDTEFMSSDQLGALMTKQR